MHTSPSDRNIVKSPEKKNVVKAREELKRIAKTNLINILKNNNEKYSQPC